MTRPDSDPMIMIPKSLLEKAVFCAIFVSREQVYSDGVDMLVSAAQDILDRAPCDVEDLTAAYDGTGKYEGLYGDDQT